MLIDLARDLQPLMLELLVLHFVCWNLVFFAERLISRYLLSVVVYLDWLPQTHWLPRRQSSSVPAFWQQFALAQSQPVTQSQSQTTALGEVANGSEDSGQRLPNELIACADWYCVRYQSQQSHSFDCDQKELQGCWLD